jgi:DNA-binding SARP family transcriptional activator
MASRGKLQQFHLRLLGELQIQVNGKQIHQHIPAKSQALLIYLAVEHDRIHNRESLAELLWPERPPDTGRNNLRQALWNLRKHLPLDVQGSELLRADREGIQFLHPGGRSIDALEIEELVVACDKHQHPEGASCEDCESRLERAVELYGDEFLANFSLPDSDPFDHWASVERERIRQIAVRALRKLAGIYEEKQQYRDALKLTERLIEIEPWMEQSYLSAMRYLAELGRRTAALRMFERCTTMLQAEFGIRPSNAAVELKERIANGQLRAAPLDLKRSTMDEVLAWPIKQRWESKKTLFYRLFAAVGVSITLFTALYFGVYRNPRDADSNPTAAPLPTLTLVPVQPPLPEEREVLVAFFETTKGGSWRHADGWLSQESHCDWFGIYCVNGRITQIVLPNNGLSGTLPAEISNLRELSILDLTENAIGGRIPRDLGSIRHLNTLNLSYNQFQGRIPPELGNLRELGDLVLKGNASLSGPIPPEIGNLRELRYLSLSSYDSGTMLSGELPPELGNLQKLFHLEICNTNITGSIPDEIGNLTGLQFIDISNNPFSGSLPDSLGNLTNLRFFAAGESENWLEGPLPLSLVNLEKILYFQYHETFICEPDDPALHAWLASVPELYRTGLACEDGD